MKTLVLVTILFFLTSICNADVFDSTAKILSSQGCGTVVFYKEDAERFYFLTAAHVTQNLKNPKIELYHDCRISESISVTILYEAYTDKTDEDFAIGAVLKKDIKDYTYPKITPLAPKDYKIKEESVITSCGCSNGNWPSLFKGKIRTARKAYFSIYPDIIPGRSGSGVFDEKGEYIIGVVIWKTGRIVPINKIWEYVEKFEEEKKKPTDILLEFLKQGLKS